MQALFKARVATWAVAVAGMAALPAGALAQELTAAQAAEAVRLARDTAAQLNAQIQARGPGEGLPELAVASGRNITLVHYLSLAPNVSQRLVNDWAAELRPVVLTMACSDKVTRPPINQGLSYTFDYRTRAGQVLGQVEVDKAACEQAGL